MKNKICLSLCAMGLLFLLTANAATKDLRKVCFDLLSKTIAAGKAKNWEQVESFANQRLKECGTFFDKEMYLTAYEDIALANSSLKKFDKVISACDACLNALPSHNGCKLLKASALFQLGRVDESKTLLSEAESTLPAQIKQTQDALQKPNNSPAAINIYKTRLEHLFIQQALAKSIHQIIYGNAK